MDWPMLFMPCPRDRDAPRTMPASTAPAVLPSSVSLVLVDGSFFQDEVGVGVVSAIARDHRDR